MNGRDDRLPALFGRRVSLRHRIAAEDAPGPHLSDAVGELADGGPGPDGAPTVRVHTRSGPVRVRAGDVVAVREVPAAPPRRPSWSAVARLERICARAWPAPLVRELGEWRLRAGCGFTRRANSALAVGDPGRPVPDALAEVRRFADEQGIPPVVASPQGSPWWRAVRSEGWQLMPDDGAESIALVAGLEVLASAVGSDDWSGVEPDAGHRTGAPAGPASGPGAGPRSDGTGPAAAGRITFATAPDPEWFAVFGESDADRASAARRAVLEPDGLPLGFGLARGADGVVNGAVRSVVVDDHVYLSRLEVLPHARRTGVATALTAAAARWAAGQGARYAVLQVIGTNTAARALYERMGCTEHHRYHYLAPGS